MIINNDTISLKLSNNASNKNKQITNNLLKLSSGNRINSASDDAAGISISTRLSSVIRGTSQANKNIQDGKSLLKTADSALNTIQNILQKVRELSILASNETLSAEDKFSIQLEIEELKDEIDHIATSSRFNEIQLLGPSKEEIITNTNPADIVFVIDNTGSMGSLQQQIADNIYNIVDKIQTMGANDIRMGIVEYTNNENNMSSFGGSKWTSDPSAIKTEIERLSTLNRGGTENTFAAIDYTIANYDFRPNIGTQQSKHIILVTNEDADDGSSYLSTTSNLQSNEIALHSVYPFNFKDPATPIDVTEFEETTNATNGTNVNIDNSLWGQAFNKLIGSLVGRKTVFKPFSENINFHVGSEHNDTIGANLIDSRTTSLGIDDVNVLSNEFAISSIQNIDKAIETISKARSDFGSKINRLEKILSYNENYKIKNEETLSQLKDVDIAKESSELIKNKIIFFSSLTLIKESTNRLENILTLLSKE